MLKFSDILKAEGVPVEKTKLARHSDKAGIGAYRLWQDDIKRFEEYQSLQDSVSFDPGGFVASFVLTPSNENLFVGLYDVINRRDCDADARCALSQKKYQAGEAWWHDMRRSDKMTEYIAKLVISWGTLTPQGEKKLAQGFVQKASYEKRVVTILRESFQVPFPGFRNFYLNVDEAGKLPENWRQPLREVWGIYLLVCNATGKKYVGAAYGIGGLLGRLLDYKNPQAIDHTRLVKHDKNCNNGRGYQCCILDIVTPGVAESEITLLESLWKEKLRTRDEWGLNDN